MRTKKSRGKPPDKFDRDLDRMIEGYVAATGDPDWTRDKVAVWAINNNLYEQRKTNTIKELGKAIARRAREITIPGDDGTPVRKYHAWQLGHDQPTFWSPIETITPEHMTISINDRRDKLVNGAVKAVVDAEHYNKHYNPGDPITIELDLTRDVQEKRQPGLYDDVPPDDTDSD